MSHRGGVARLAPPGQSRRVRASDSKGCNSPTTHASVTPYAQAITSGVPMNMSFIGKSILAPQGDSGTPHND